MGDPVLTLPYRGPGGKQPYWATHGSHTTKSPLESATSLLGGPGDNIWVTRGEAGYWRQCVSPLPASWAPSRKV